MILLAAAFSLLYTGGMYLNDAFDREVDARERPERPIPSGRVRAGSVFAIGFGLLGMGIADRGGRRARLRRAEVSGPSRRARSWRA